MSDWSDVAPVQQFPPGSCRCLVVDGVDIAVFNIEGRYYAIEDLCTHEASTLSDGTLEGLEIICPLHAARFSLLTGEALSPPAYEPLTLIPVRVDNGMVQVRDERFG